MLSRLLSRLRRYRKKWRVDVSFLGSFESRVVALVRAGKGCSVARVGGGWQVVPEGTEGREAVAADATDEPNPEVSG